MKTYRFEMITENGKIRFGRTMSGDYECCLFRFAQLLEGKDITGCNLEVTEMP